MGSGRGAAGGNAVARERTRRPIPSSAEVGLRVRGERSTSILDSVRAPIAFGGWRVPLSRAAARVRAETRTLLLPRARKPPTDAAGSRGGGAEGAGAGVETKGGEQKSGGGVEGAVGRVGGCVVEVGAEVALGVAADEGVAEEAGRAARIEHRFRWLLRRRNERVQSPHCSSPSVAACAALYMQGRPLAPPLRLMCWMMA